MVRLVADKPIIIRNKVAGIIKASRIYVTHRSKEHYFRKYNGFGLSASVIEEIKKYDVDIIKIIYNKVDGTQEIYTAPVNRFYEKGVIYNDNGDFQRILNINEFKKVV